MLIGSAIETLRDEAPLPRQKAVGIFDMPHLLLPLRQSSLRGTATMLVNSMGHDMYPVTRTAATVCGSFIRKMRHYGEPHLFALNGEHVNDLLNWLSEAPSYGPEFFTGYRIMI